MTEELKPCPFCGGEGYVPELFTLDDLYGIILNEGMDIVEVLICGMHEVRARRAMEREQEVKE